MASLWALPSCIVVAGYVSFIDGQGSSIIHGHHFFAAVVLALIFGFLNWAIRRLSEELQLIFISGLLVLFLDSQIDISQMSLPILKLVSSSGSGWATTQLTIAGLLVAVLAVLLIRYRNTSGLILGSFFAFLLILTLGTSTVTHFAMRTGANTGISFSTQLFDQAKQPVAGQVKRPTIIHMVFDAHGSLAIADRDSSQGREVKHFALSVLKKYNFTINSNSYSRFFQTHDSIPSLLNFATPDIHKAFLGDRNSKSSVTELRALREKSDEGYEIDVYQSSYIDFCHAEKIRYRSCRTYKYESVMASIDQMDGIWRPAQYSLSIFVTSSPLIAKGRVYFNRIGRPRILAWTGLEIPLWDAPQAPLMTMALQLMADLKVDVVRLKGNAHYYFVHLLAPHAPFSVDRNCDLKEPIGYWTDSVDPDATLAGLENTEDSRARAYEEYFSQLTCLYSRLDNMFSYWTEQGVLDEAIIVLHGDHGSRLSLNWPRSLPGHNVRQNDWDNFATVYAVHLPNQSVANEIDGLFAIQDLYFQTMTGEDAVIETKPRVRIRDTLVSNKGIKLKERAYHGHLYEMATDKQDIQ